MDKKNKEEEKVQIKSVTLTDGTKLKAKDYFGQSLFEEDVLYNVGEKQIEYYAMRHLGLNTEEYHLENAWEKDLVDALEDMGYNFIDEVDIDDAIDFVECEGYTVLEKGIRGEDLDIVDSNRLKEITDKFVNGSFAEREYLYKLIMK